jgi:hypothetical protein
MREVARPCVLKSGISSSAGFWHSAPDSAFIARCLNAAACGDGDMSFWQQQWQVCGTQMELADPFIVEALEGIMTNRLETTCAERQQQERKR